MISWTFFFLFQQKGRLPDLGRGGLHGLVNRALF